MVGVSGATTPHGDGAVAAMGTRVRCQHGTVGAAGDVPQAGDEVADGAVAVSPADQFTQTVRGGLKRVGHDRQLEKIERRQSLRPAAQVV